jgi:hypothetical protein
LWQEYFGTEAQHADASKNLLKRFPAHELEPPYSAFSKENALTFITELSIGSKAIDQ